MEKKNTVLLTVIAIATLLVAVVGATFAYFSADTSNNNASVQVTGKTAAAADIFKTEGGTALSFSVTADKMQKDAAALNLRNAGYSQTTTDTGITVSLTAGSSTATCKYDVVYVPSTAFVASTASASASTDELKKEFTIDATCSDNDYSVSNIDAKGSGSALTGLASGTGIMLKQDAEISDTYSDSNPSQPNVQTWKFAAGVVNRDYDQTDLVEKDSSFGGTIQIINVRCTNAATVAP